MKKKAAIFYSGAKTWGGVEAYLYNLLSEENKDIDFFLLSMGGWELTKKLEKISTILSAKRANPFLIFKIKRFLEVNDIDLIISQGVVSNFYARLTSFIFKFQNLCIVHSDISAEYKNPIIKNLYLLSDNLLKSVTKSFICVSEYMRGVLIKRGVNSEKITVIYNGVDVSKQIATNNKQKTANSKFIIGSIGRLEKEKGHDILIESAKYLPENIEIQICGEGRERKKLEEIIQKNSFNEKVKLLGFCDDINKFYSQIDLYIQPSRSEGFGLTVIEAMAVGLPVLVSTNGALPEIVKDGENGIVIQDLNAVKIAEEIMKRANEKEKLKKIGENGKKTVEEKFSLKDWREKTINFIKECAI